MRWISILILAAAASAQDSPWERQVLPAKPEWVVTGATDINEAGDVCGYWAMDWKTSHALVWTGGTYIEVEVEFGLPLGYDSSSVITIDNTGRFAGYVQLGDFEYPGNRQKATVWDTVTGTYEVVHPDGFGIDNSRIADMTDSGLAVGDVLDLDENTRRIAYLWDLNAGTGRALDFVEGFGAANANGVNESGEVAGWAADDGWGEFPHAVFWRADGSALDIHPFLRAAAPEIFISQAWGITEDGLVTGAAWDETYEKIWVWTWREGENVTFLDRGPGNDAMGTQSVGKLVVGNIGHWTTTIQGAIWVEGILHRLPPMPGFDDVFLHGANTRGQAIGDAILEGFDYQWWLGSRAFIAEPRADGDFDNDGLNDKWELQGYVHDNNVAVDLPGMGANPLRRDLFVEIDSMVGNGFDHRPTATTLQPVVEAFAAQGIALFISIDDDIPFQGELGTLDGLGRYQWAEFDALKAAHFAPELESAVRYCVFAHKLATLTDSGAARGEPSSDFIVSLGAFVEVSGNNDPWMQAGTFMHELGHTLGLRHGGADVNNQKPNYLSVMNYDFQKQGLRIGGQDGNFNYSCCKLPSLDENALDENAGLGTSPLITGAQTLYRVLRFNPVTLAFEYIPTWSGDVTQPIDWNGNGALDGVPVAADLNGDGSTGLLVGHDDWSGLDFKGGTVGFGVGLPPPLPPPETEVAEELTVEVAKLILPPAVEGLAGRAGRGSVRVSWTAVGPVGQGLYSLYRWSSTQSREDAALVKETEASLASDRAGRGTWNYVVTVTDSLGAESLDSEVLTVRVR